MVLLIGALIGSYLTSMYLERIYEEQINNYESTIEEQKRILYIADRLIKKEEDLVQVYEVLMKETFNTLIELRDHGTKGLDDTVIRIGNVVFGPEEAK